MFSYQFWSSYQVYPRGKFFAHPRDDPVTFVARKLGGWGNFYHEFHDFGGWEAVV